MGKPSLRAAPGGVFGSALVAAAIALLIAFIVRSLFGLATPAELFGDRITQLIPLSLFSTLLVTFGTNAKHLYFAGLLAGEGILTALTGLLYWRARAYVRWLAEREPTLADVPLLALLLWLLSAGLLAPLIGGGWFGAALVGGAPAVLFSEVVPSGIFALVFVLLLRQPAELAETAEAPSTVTSLSRRRLLRQGAVAVAILGGGALAWEAITGVFGGLLGLGARGRQYPLATQATPRRIVPPPQPTYGAWTPVRGQTPEVTATPDFYYVSKGLAGDPTIGVADWRLQIGGMVARPYTLTYSDLMALPATERYHTLECISNEVGGDLMSNALWRGVRLADLLNQAGIQAGASEFIFRARDGYSDSLHLSQALDPRSLVVYLINGEPLPRPHGFPARLLVPGLYGMKNGKWLTSLELGPGGYTGYWEQQGWSREARVKTTTRIDVPTDGDVLLSRPLTLAGVAYAGDRGIARVDVSVDAGRTWQPATLHRPLDDLTWVLWEFPWIPPAGTYVIAARAVDRDGYVQTPAPSPTLPDGASGYNAIQISVR